MTKTRIRNLALGVGVAVVLVGALVAVTLTYSSRSPTSASASHVVASDVTFTYLDGRPGSIADFEGTPVVFNFFASWCGPCWQEMPGFERVWGARQGEVQFIGIALQDEPSAVQAILERTAITYPVAEDPDGSIFRLLGGLGMPTTVFFDREGNVFRTESGEISADRMSDIVDDLVAA